MTEEMPRKSSVASARTNTNTMARGRDFFDRAMEPETRVAEAELRRKLEMARMKIHVRKAEKAAMTERLDSTRKAVAKIEREIDDLNTALMTRWGIALLYSRLSNSLNNKFRKCRLHSFSRDKQSLQEWKQRHNVLSAEPDKVADGSDAVGAGVINFLNRAVQASQYELFSDLKLLYSIQNPKEVLHIQVV